MPSILYEITVDEQGLLETNTLLANNSPKYLTPFTWQLPGKRCAFLLYINWRSSLTIAMQRSDLKGTLWI